MLPDLKLEVIYFKTSTDFKMEFKLCSLCNVRYLSAMVNDTRSFLTALQKSVSRSRVVITVGGFNGDEYVPEILAKATGSGIAEIKANEFSDEKMVTIPSGAVPMYSKSGEFGGAVIEKGDQSIIMLTENNNLKHELLDLLVGPYIKLLISKKPTVASKEQTENKREEKTAEATNEEIKAAAPTTNEQPEEKASQPIETEQIEEIVNAEEVEEVEAVEDNEITEEIETAKTEQPIEAEESTFWGEALTKDNIETANYETLEEVSSEVEEIEEKEEIKEETTPSFETVEETHDPLKDIVLKKMDVSLFESGSHDKFIDPAEEALFVEEELYVGKHSKKSVEQLTNENSKNLTDADEVILENNDFKVKELPNELDRLDELSYNIKPDSKGKRVLKAVIAIILVLLVIVGSFFGYRYFYQPTQGQSIYQSILSLYGQDSPVIEETNILSKFGKLYELNSNLTGFISVPNSSINYPVVKTTTAGKVYYETHLFDGTFNGYGTPYTYNTVSGNSYNRNIIIYGNTVKTGAMFSDLTKYTNLHFYRSSPIINFDTLYEIRSYKVFSVLQFSGNSFNYAQNNFFDDQEFLDYLTLIKNASKIDTNIDLLGADSIITLVTQNEGLTTCVVARAVRDGESPLVDVSESALNTDPGSLKQESMSSNYEGGLTEIIENNISGGRHEEELPISSQIQITASEYVPSSSSSVTTSTSSVYSSNVSTSSVVTSIISSAQNPTAPLPTLYVTNDSAGGVKVSGSTLDILSRIVEAEMGSGYEVEALKAQAVCKYSWLLCSGATNGKSYPGVAMKTASNKTINAVKEVLGVVARYNGKVAQTFCYAFSAGKTAKATDLWGGSYPWVRAVDSSVDKNAKNFLTTNTYKSEDIAKWVKAYYKDIDLTKIADKNAWFVPEYDSNNLYVTWITIGGVKKRGSHLRTYILTSANCGSGKGLRSPAYTISYNAATDSFTFTVKGYGHGAGLSQFGANQYAKNGWSYEKILKHYFTGIDLGISYGN